MAAAPAVHPTHLVMRAAVAQACELAALCVCVLTFAAFLWLQIYSSGRALPRERDQT